MIVVKIAEITITTKYEMKSRGCHQRRVLIIPDPCSFVGDATKLPNRRATVVKLAALLSTQLRTSKLSLPAPSGWGLDPEKQFHRWEVFQNFDPKDEVGQRV